MSSTNQTNIRRRKREKELKVTVMTQFHYLEKLYRNIFGTDKGEHNMPMHLCKLLPISHGWCFSPIWRAPRRLEHWKDLRLRTSHHPSKDWLTGNGLTLIEEVERIVIARAHLHLAVHHSLRVISNALYEDAPVYRSEPLAGSQALSGEAELVAWINSFRVISVESLDPSVDPTDAALHDLRRAWLRRWLEMERLRIARLRQVGKMSVTSRESPSLVKAAELAEVYDIYNNYLIGDLDPVSYLGRWYYSSLCRFGLQHRTLYTMRQNEMRQFHSDSKKTSGFKFWGLMALRRVENYEKNEARKLRKRNAAV